MDKVLEKALKDERERQENNIELIASKNFVSNDELKLQGSILTNKYAEGYPSKRYYGGCEYIDIFEEKAREYAKELFGCKYANVQPHSGSSANMAVYRALINKGDTVMGMNLSDGGHLTHGHPLNFSGSDYRIVDYKVNPDTICRYTGRNDKNGNFIWENDVLRGHGNPKDLAKATFGEFYVIDVETLEKVDSVYGWHTEVIPTDALSKCEPFCLPMPLTEFYISRSEYEVIGNIFDNPELLEELAE